MHRDKQLVSVSLQLGAIKPLQRKRAHWGNISIGQIYPTMENVTRIWHEFELLSRQRCFYLHRVFIDAPTFHCRLGVKSWLQYFDYFSPHSFYAHKKKRIEMQFPSKCEEKGVRHSFPVKKLKFQVSVDPRHIDNAII